MKVRKPRFKLSQESKDAIWTWVMIFIVAGIILIGYYLKN